MNKSHKFSPWILFASAPVNSYCMSFSSFSFPSLFTYEQIVWIQSVLFVAITIFSKQFTRKLSTTFTKSLNMQWSSWSKHVFERDDSHAISCAISRQEKAGLQCLPRTGWHLIPFPSPRPPQRVYGRTLRHNQIFSDGWFTKFSYPWCSAIINWWLGFLRDRKQNYFRQFRL